MEKRRIEMGLTVTGTNALANPLMKEQADKMLTAVVDGLMAGWNFATAVNEVVSKELFKDDFGSQARFATWAGLSPARISQIKGACAFAVEYEKRNGQPLPPFASVDGCYSLNRVHNDIMECGLNEGEFTVWLLAETKANNVFAVGSSTIWRKYNEWKAIQLADNSDIEIADVPEQTEQEKENMVEIYYNGEAFLFPESILKKYAVPVNGNEQEK